MKPTNTKTFCPIPARAICDKRLTAVEWRVLSAICAHDRLGANGVGCYASIERLAGMAECHVKSTSRAISNLAHLKYLEIRKVGRSNFYTVQYSDLDKVAMKAAKGNETVTYKAANNAEIGNNLAGVFEQIGNKIPEIGNKDFEKPEKSQGFTDDNIFNKSRETDLNKLREAQAALEDEEVTDVCAKMDEPYAAPKTEQEAVEFLQALCAKRPLSELWLRLFRDKLMAGQLTPSEVEHHLGKVA